MRRRFERSVWIAIAPTVLCACASTSAWERTLATVRSHGWTLDVVARLTNRYEPGTILRQGRDEWPVEVDLNARRASSEAIELGTLWFRIDADETRSRRLYEALAADACADASGRVALRLRGLPAPREHERHEARYHAFDRPWWIVEAFDSVVAPTRVRLAAPDCHTTLGQAPAPADWVRETLRAPMAALSEPVVRLRTLASDAAAHPAMRRRSVEQVAGALIVAAREELHVEDALDFMLRRDGLASQYDYSRVGEGEDVSGPLDAFPEERRRLHALVARGAAASADLEAHLLHRIVPEAGEPAFVGETHEGAIEDWMVTLVEAAPSADRRRAAADAALGACSDDAAHPRCFPWRMAALGALVSRPHDADRCARARTLAAELRASQAPDVAAAGAALERATSACAAR